MGSRKALLLLGSVFASIGCGPDIKLMSPLTSKFYDSRIHLPVGLHVPAEAGRHVATGHIWLVPYRVEFGDALEANATHALGAAFDQVILLDEFPSVSTGSPRIALELEIASSDVSPGWLTFLPSDAVVKLHARLAIDGVVTSTPVDVEGAGSASPGALGLISVLGANQIAYDSALQDACEIALGDALEKFVDASIALAAEFPK